MVGVLGATVWPEAGYARNVRVVKVERNIIPPLRI